MLDPYLWYICNTYPLWKKDLYRREGKGRRRCLETDFIQFLDEENDEFILFFTSSRFKDLKEFCVNPVRIFLRNPDPGDMITIHTYINSSPLLQPIYELFYLFIKGLIQSSLGYNFFFTNTRFIAH